MSSVKSFTVSLCLRSEIRDFIEKHHYSHNINGLMSSYCFKLLNNDKLIGACIFGRLGMANSWKKYADSERDVIELRRLVCVDDTPKNTESYFIGKMLRYLQVNTHIKRVISYADETYGHSGVIYQASNFKLIGKTPKGRMIKRLNDGKLYHDKAIRTIYNNKLKPFAEKLKQDLKVGTAVYISTLGKNIYLYELKL